MNARPPCHFSDAPNLNALWARVAVEEFRRQGVGLMVVCPGARCAPVVAAISQQTAEVQRVIVHDERAAGFLALGHARATGNAAVVVTTSGTAVANLLPAMVEASRSSTPMIVLTADRPPELRDCGANQCVSQPGLLSGACRWTTDIPCPDEAISLEWLLSTVDEAISRANGSSGHAGPVHLNWMFREPLGPELVHWNPQALAPIAGWITQRHAWRRMVSAQDGVDALVKSASRAIRSAAMGAQRQIVCAGAISSPAMREFTRELCRQLGWPVLADAASGLRHGQTAGKVIAHADLIALASRGREALQPDFVLRLGGVVTSRRVGEFLSRARDAGARELVVREGPERIDPDHGATHELALRLPADFRSHASESGALPQETCTASSFASAWSSADNAAANSLAAQLDAPGRPLDEPTVARAVAGQCPSGTTLMIGNSMAIRDAEMHISASARAIEVVANRGASGIDGLVATAVGHAHAVGKPVWLLLGDLALLHDLGSLALVAASPVPLVIVVVNNDGGGIFHFLPLAADERVLEPWTTAPHGIKFGGAASMFGMEHCSMGAQSTLGNLVDALRDGQARAVACGKSTIIEVLTDRFANVSVHRSIQAAVSQAIDGALCGDADAVRARSTGVGA